MSLTPAQAAAELPASSAHHPAKYLLYPFRPLGRLVIRRRIKVRIVNGEKLPRTGPVIIACNHVGVADGPLLAIFAPRPVHALTKEEMFKGFMNRFLLSTGQIPLDRFHPDPLAVKRCLKVLRSGHVVGIFPEGSRGGGEFHRFHTGAAYLAMVTGAPIVPVVQFGTRDPGAGNSSLPSKGVVVDMVFGDAIHIPQTPWPRRKRDVAARSVELRQKLVTFLDDARTLTGRTLPGPVPGEEADPDPATGITDVDDAEAS